MLRTLHNASNSKEILVSKNLLPHPAKKRKSPLTFHKNSEHGSCSRLNDAQEMRGTTLKFDAAVVLFGHTFKKLMDNIPLSAPFLKIIADCTLQEAGMKSTVNINTIKRLGHWLPTWATSSGRGNKRDALELLKDKITHQRVRRQIARRHILNVDETASK
eukprot:3518084-Amphidinium_carterae.1